MALGRVDSHCYSPGLLWSATDSLSSHYHGNSWPLQMWVWSQGACLVVVPGCGGRCGKCERVQCTGSALGIDWIPVPSE